MKHVAWLLTLVLFSAVSFSQTNALNDGDWTKQSLVMKNTPEAEVMTRTGDIDNLNFLFPEGFNPFCGIATDSHDFPWETNVKDAKGTDCIMVPSSFNPESAPCGNDGYTGTTYGMDKKPEVITLPLDAVRNLEVHNAVLLMFVDDFQSPDFCSQFQMTINGKRFPEAEKLLNALRQGGPIGKLIIIPVTQNFYKTLHQDELKIFIDDPTTKAGDGFAIDFVKLLVNYKPEFACIGFINGTVVDQETGESIANASVEIPGFGTTTTRDDGTFTLEKLPAGTHVVFAYATGYESGASGADVWDDGGEEITIYLNRSDKFVNFNGQDLQEGESVVFNKILFDVNSSVLKTESKTELDKIVAFLKTNPTTKIELSGHTSSEGSRELNVELSFDRVNSCRDYIVSKGIDAGRIAIVGLGPDKPVASNDTEDARKQNRRVEMRILEL